MEDYWLLDICFCDKFMCKRHDCRRHQVNKPSDVPYLSQASFCEDLMYEKCPYYLNKNKKLF